MHFCISLFPIDFLLISLIIINFGSWTLATIIFYCVIKQTNKNTTIDHKTFHSHFNINNNNTYNSQIKTKPTKWNKMKLSKQQLQFYAIAVIMNSNISNISLGCQANAWSCFFVCKPKLCKCPSIISCRGRDCCSFEVFR